MFRTLFKCKQQQQSIFQPSRNSKYIAKWPKLEDPCAGKELWEKEFEGSKENRVSQEEQKQKKTVVAVILL